jgi:hypothetical protein
VNKAGTGTFTLPSDLPAGYKIYILAEDANGAYYTDYASIPVAITATEVTQPPAANNGKVEVLPLEEKTDNTVVGHLANTDEEIKTAVLTDADKEVLASGKDISVWIETKDNEAAVPQEDKVLITEQMPTTYQVGTYLDINLWKQVEGESAVKITNVQNGNVKISLSVPTELQKAGRHYKIMRIHDGEVTILDTELDTTDFRLTFETDRFSTYALIYTDEDNDNTPGGNTPDSGNATATSPKTGDTNAVMAWFWMFFLSLGGAVALCVCERKKKRFEK